MKFKYILMYFMALATVSCGHNNADSHENHEADKHESHDGLIELSENEANRFGIVCSVASESEIAETTTLPASVVSSLSTTTTLSAARQGKLIWTSRLHEGMAVKAGQTIATVSSSGVTGGDTDAAARVRLEALEAEIKRVTPLVGDGIVSRKDYNALIAEAAQQRRLTQTAAGSAAIVSPVSGIITQIVSGNGAFVNQGDLIATVQADEKQTGAMLRVDIPQRLSTRMSDIRSATITTPDGKAATLPRSTSATATDASGFIPVYFGPTDTHLITGATMEAKVAFGSKSATLSLPLDAINEQEGVYSVFVKEKAGHYRRMPVTIGMTDADRAEIVSGITPTDSVVVSGAIFLRLAETRANAPQGHSHNH